MRVLALALPVLLASCMTSPAHLSASPLPPHAVANRSAPQSCPPSPEAIHFDGSIRQGGAVRGRVAERSVAVDLDGRAVPLAKDGSFLIAFDRDAPATATLRVVSGNGCGSVERPLTIASGNWNIQSVNAPITGGAASSAEFQARRGGELAKIAAARAVMRPDSSEGWRQPFVWPVVARISGRFGSQRIYRGTPGSYHSGVDLAAPTGTVYVAPADGVVILAADAPYTLEGNLLLIDHGMGLNSAFLHSQRLLVKVGDVVRRGQPIGIVGATGRVSGPHLHWGMKWNDARLDPVTLVDLATPAH